MEVEPPLFVKESSLPRDHAIPSMLHFFKCAPLNQSSVLPKLSWPLVPVPFTFGSFQPRRNAIVEEKILEVIGGGVGSYTCDVYVRVSSFG